MLAVTYLPYKMRLQSYLTVSVSYYNLHDVLLNVGTLLVLNNKVVYTKEINREITSI